MLLFLNCCEGNIDETVEKLETYYEIKRSMPEFFANRDVKSETIQHCFDCLAYVALPVTPDNCNLIVQRLRSTNPKDYMFEDAVKTYIMKAEEYSYNNGPRSGTIFLNDLRGATIWHLFRVSLSSISKGMKFLQEASPLNVKAIHIMNTVPFVNAIINMVKPFVWSEVMNKVHFHSSNIDFEQFYKEHIPKSNLPSDYGGDLESIEELHNKQREDFFKMRDYFLAEEKQKDFEYDEYVDEFLAERTRCLYANGFPSWYARTQSTWFNRSLCKLFIINLRR